MIFVTFPPSNYYPPQFVRIAWEDDGEYLTRLCEGSINMWSDPTIEKKLYDQKESSIFGENEFSTIKRFLALGRKLK